MAPPRPSSVGIFGRAPGWTSSGVRLTGLTTIAVRGRDAGGLELGGATGSGDRSRRCWRSAVVRSGTARSEAARSCAGRFGGGGLPRVVAEPTRDPAAPGRTEICWRRVLPGTDGSTVAGVGRKYMRGCSGRRLAPPERVGSRERAGAASTAGRIPDELPSLRGYDEMTGSCTSADAAPETESPVCGSLEVFAPPSVLPKILVRSPNVEFPYLKSASRSPVAVSEHRACLVPLDAELVAPTAARRSKCTSYQIAVADVERRFGSHSHRSFPLLRGHTRCFAITRAPPPAVFRYLRGHPNPLFWLERGARPALWGSRAGIPSLLGAH